MKSRNSGYRLPPPERLQAFTLSEVLITLMILGIVASLTLPEMIADWQKQATVVRLKKMYSTFSNAINRAVAEKGSIHDWTHYSPGNNLGIWDPEYVAQFFVEYMNVAQVCEYGKNDVCNYDITHVINSSISYKGKIHDYPYDWAFVLADGSVAILTEGCGHLYILMDINGPAKPNVVGRDIFEFDLEPHSSGDTIFAPCGWYSANNREKWLEKCKYDSKYYCAGLIMADGWQIKDDYPW